MPLSDHHQGGPNPLQLPHNCAIQQPSVPFTKV